MIEKLKPSGITGFPWEDEDGVVHSSKLDYLQIEILKFCGCGDPVDNLVYIKEMLSKLKNEEFDYFENRQDMFFLYWADKEGFTEHGGSIHCSWLTPLGEELLSDLEELLEDSLIGKKVLYNGEEFNIIDRHNTSDFVIIDDDYNSIINLNSENVNLKID